MNGEWCLSYWRLEIYLRTRTLAIGPEHTGLGCTLSWRRTEMAKTKEEQSKELDAQVAEFLKNGGEIEQVDTTVSQLKSLTVSRKFFAKTHYLVVNNKKE